MVKKLRIQSNENISNLRELYQQGGVAINHQTACIFCNYLPVLERMYKITESLGLDEPKVVRYIKNICRVLNQMYISRSPSVILGTALWFSGELYQNKSADLVGTTAVTLRAMKKLLRYWYYFWKEEE